MAEAVFQQVLPHLRVITGATPVFKDECAFSFHTQVRVFPFSSLHLLIHKQCY